MDLDRKPARRSGGKAQRCHDVRHNVTFDVVTVKVDVQRFVRGQAHYNVIVLEN